jgi:hypothetical protein
MANSAAEAGIERVHASGFGSVTVPVSPQPPILPSAAATSLSPVEPVRRFSRGSEVRITVRGFKFHVCNIGTSVTLLMYMGHQVVSSYLTQRSPFFQEQLGASNPGNGATLQLDCDPIDFEHFLEALHCGSVPSPLSLVCELITHDRPIETEDLLSAPVTPDTVTKLLAVVEIANKYEDSRLGTWALRHALATLGASEEPITLAVIDRLVRITTSQPTTEPDTDRSLCRRVQELVIGAMKSHALSNADIIGHIILPTSNNPTMSEPCMFLLAHAYYYILQGDHKVWTTDTRLDSRHRRRLFCGHFALTTAWQDRLRTTESDLHTSSIFCDELRQELEVHAFPLCALLERIQALEEAVDRLGFNTPREVLGRTLESEREHLWEYFDITRWDI